MPPRCSAGLLGFAMLFALQGCLYAGLDVDEIHKSINEESLTFPAGPLEGQRVAASRDFEVNLADELGSDLLDLLQNVRVKDATVVPTEGVSDLDFVDLASVHIESAGDLPPVTLAIYKKGDSGARTEDGGFTVPINDEIDTTAYFRQATRFRIDLEHVPPTTDWRIGIELTFEVNFEYRRDLL